MPVGAAARHQAPPADPTGWAAARSARRAFLKAMRPACGVRKSVWLLEDPSELTSRP